MDVVSTVSSSVIKTVASKVEFVDEKNKEVCITIETKPVRKNKFSPLIIQDWNFDDESEVEDEPKIEVKTVRPCIENIKFVKTASFEHIQYDCDKRVVRPVWNNSRMRLARKNELKARGTLLMALLDKHRLKFNTHKDAKTLIEAIKKRFRVRARRFLQWTGRNLGANGPASMGFDMSKVECCNCHRKGHFVKECSYDWSFQADEEPTNYALMAFTSSSSSYDNEVFTRAMFDCDDCDDYYTSESDESLPPSPIYDRYQSGNRPIKPDNDLSHTHRPSTPIIKDWVSDLEDESETKTPQNVLSFVETTEQVKSPRPYVQHVETYIPTATPKIAIPKPKTKGHRRNRKACFVCKSLSHLIKDCNYHEKKMAQTTVRHHAIRGNHQHYARMTLPNPHRHVVPTVVLTQSKLVPITAVKPVTTTVLKTNAARPTHAKTVVTKPHSQPRRHINRSPSPKASTFLPKVTAAKASMVNAIQGGQGKLGNPHHALKDKGVIDSGCSRHMTGNMSYLSDFEELNGGYVAFGKNSKGGKISGKGLENQLSLKVKIVRSDNGTEFKNHDLNQFCGIKGIKREFSVPKTPQQNGIAERKNKTLIEAARTMLADLLLPISFWVEAVNIACYVQNRVLVTKPHNKTPYKLIHGRTPSICFMRPFGCHVTILNTLDSLSKFDENVDKGFLVGYSVSSNALFYSRNQIVQETLHVNFMENKPNIAGSGPTWPFDIDTLTRTMNYQPVTAGNQSNHTEPEFERRNPESEVNVSLSSSAQSKKHDDKTKREAKGKSLVESLTRYRNLSAEFKYFTDNSINGVNAAGNLVPAVG
nr:retrovirus-related Pol polyprotein from transposon TNT 1-94 [Tanacetum cinerariifolium]